MIKFNLYYLEGDNFLLYQEVLFLICLIQNCIILYNFALNFINIQLNVKLKISLNYFSLHISAKF
jgi:hypothetical protein